MFLKFLTKIILSLTVIFAFGCGTDGGDGKITNEIDLPTDESLPLYCEDEGIHPNNCVLENPDNPYALVNVTEENKWDLHDDAPSAKARFYLWATALTRIPSGENQYYVADSLHELYTLGTSINAKEQAKRAYRAVLDKFYDSHTYWIATWLPDQPTYAVLLRDLTGMRLYDPSENSLSFLYDDPYYALEELAEWGYNYDVSYVYDRDCTIYPDCQLVLNGELN